MLLFNNLIDYPSMIMLVVDIILELSLKNASPSSKINH